MFNHIAEIKKADLTVSNLQQCNVKPSTLAQSVIRACLDILLLNSSSNNQQSMRDDQACLPPSPSVRYIHGCPTGNTQVSVSKAKDAPPC